MLKLTESQKLSMGGRVLSILEDGNPRFTDCQEFLIWRLVVTAQTRTDGVPDEELIRVGLGRDMYEYLSDRILCFR